MNKKQLIKCSKALRKIEKLDLEIINIDKIAMLVSDGKFESSFELKINDLSHKEEQKKQLFDEDGSLNFGGSPYGLMAAISKAYGCYAYPLRTPQEKKSDFVLNPVLSESSILRILGVLLSELQEERNALLNELQQHGVEI